MTVNPSDIQGLPSEGESISGAFMELLQDLAEEAASGGSQPGISVAEFVFEEVDTADNVSYAIIAADDMAGTFTIAGDHTVDFPTNRHFSVAGSTGNDGLYTVGDATLVDGDTVITVPQGVLDTTADGNIQYGRFTATLDLPEGATVLDVQALPLAVPWSSSYASLDAVDGQGVVYLQGVDLINGLIETCTDVLGDGAGLGSNWLNTRDYGGQGATWTWFGNSVSFIPGPGVRYAADDTLSVVVITTNETTPISPTGRTAIRIYYTAPVVSGTVVAG